jgi:hypothetical protein
MVNHEVVNDNVTLKYRHEEGKSKSMSEKRTFQRVFQKNTYGSQGRSSIDVFKEDGRSRVIADSESESTRRQDKGRR